MPTVVFGHQALHRDSTEAHTVKNADVVRGILEADGQVLAYFNGHDHSGEFVEINGIAYCMLRGNVGISQNWPDLGTDGLDVITDNQFALVEITDLGDGQYQLDVNGYGRQQSYSTVIPEPATMSLLALGALAAIRRRRGR